MLNHARQAWWPYLALEVVHLAAAQLLQEGRTLPWPVSVFFGTLPIRDDRGPYGRAWEWWGVWKWSRVFRGCLGRWK